MSSEKKKHPKISMETISFEDLQEIGIEAHIIARLSEDDLTAITHNMLLHLNLDVFSYELKWQVYDLLEERKQNPKE